MKLGLRPVVYEADRIGGRLRTASFRGRDPASSPSWAAMRFPPSCTAFYHYVDLVGPGDRAVPQPAGAGHPQHGDRARGRAHYADTAADLPPVFREVADAWNAAPRATAPASPTCRTRSARAGHRPDQGDLERAGPEAGRADVLRLPRRLGGLQGAPSATARSSARWASAPAAGTPTSPTRSWRSCASSTPTPTTDHRAIVGGGRSSCRAGCGSARPSGWPTGRTAPRCARCTAAPRARPWPGSRRTAGGRITVTGPLGRHPHYPAPSVITCQSWLLLDPDPLRRARCSRLDHGPRSSAPTTCSRPRPSSWSTGRSGRTWTRRPAATSCRMTLTDRMTRGTYLLDDGPDQPAVICLSYTWNDDALKWLPLTAERAGGGHAARRSARSTRASTSPAHHRQPDHRLLGDRPQLHGRVQGQPARPLPLPAAPVHATSCRTALPADQRGHLPRRRRHLLDRRLGRGRRDHRAQRGLGRGPPPRRASAPGNPGPGDRWDELQPLQLPDQYGPEAVG